MSPASPDLARLVVKQEVEEFLSETDVLVGKREDLLRRVNGGWRIARRKIVLDQSVLLAKNLTFSFEVIGPGEDTPES